LGLKGNYWVKGIINGFLGLNGFIWRYSWVMELIIGFNCAIINIILDGNILLLSAFLFVGSNTLPPAIERCDQITEEISLVLCVSVSARVWRECECESVRCECETV
jgi:hypothetical protein